MLPMTRTHISALAIALSLTASLGAARAEAPKSITVAYGDLNLASASGQAALDARIHDAAVKACGPVQYSLDNRGSELAAAQQANRSCIARASETANARIEASQNFAAQGKTQKLAGN
jgi:UrcA family protein